MHTTGARIKTYHSEATHTVTLFTLSTFKRARTEVASIKPHGKRIYTYVHCAQHGACSKESLVLCSGHHVVDFEKGRV